MIRKGEIGALFNITTARQVNTFQHVAVEQSRLHIPLLFGLDVIHGFRTEFPVPLGLSASWNPDLIQQTARVAAQEASASGIRWTFSPMVDIARDARWGRMTEGSGEDPYLGSVIARGSPARHSNRCTRSADLRSASTCGIRPAVDESVVIVTAVIGTLSGCFASDRCFRTSNNTSVAH